MYTRSRPDGDDTLRIPENYSGNAFHGDSLSPTPPIDPLPAESLAPQDEPVNTVSEAQPAAMITAEAVSEEAPVFKKSSPFSALLPPRLMGTRGGLLGDIGIEELLIIGILILLSQSDTDDDILLLLVLLLFYK